MGVGVRRPRRRRRRPADLSGLTKVRGMHSTPLPRKFHAPESGGAGAVVCDDMYPWVACESLASGLPVLASRRGGCPSCWMGAGFLFDVPAGYSEDVLAVPGRTRWPGGATACG